MHQFPSRRRFLQAAAFSAAAFSVRGVFAEELSLTPRQTEGPFYPNKLPLDTDNDLLIVNDAITPAVGEVTHLSGRVLSASGEPLRNALVEIWQVDHRGAYIHTGSDNYDRRDTNFQGFGRFLTGSNGEYYFRTIKPVAYTFRTPHIHFAVKRGDQRMLTTQLYVAGEPLNEQDRIYQSLGSAQQKKLLTADFTPLEGVRTGELAARFDLVIGHTPEDPEPRGPRRAPPPRR